MDKFTYEQDFDVGSLLDQVADISICTDTGAEVVTGSTRVKVDMCREFNDKK